jgi:transcriptional regulator with XRE-family HTH domain
MRRPVNTSKQDPIVVVRGRLSQTLKEKGWTQDYVAMKTGVAQPKISRFDKSKTIDPSTVASLMHGLKLGFWDLFEVVSKKDKPNYMNDEEKPGAD